MRLRVAAVCVLLTALAFLQDPGMVALDTKVDLVVNPAGWLARALHIWDPAGTFGQLQNQAYGYLWPMGPFFLVGSWLGIPGWVVQRLWWALLMSVAFTGVVRLADRLNIGTPVARLVAGAAFALSPRILTELGPVSVEAWPSAIAPWVLVPLIGLAKGEPLRRAVTRSALVVACAGGVNATAVLAVVPLAGLWLLGLRPAGLRARALLAWCLAVAAATVWWVAPLLLLGRYSPPFLEYIETAEVTTAPTDLVTILRGASHWHAYLTGAHGPAWPAGWQLATGTLLVVATLAVAALGLVGLSRPGMPHRRFLITGLLVGIALVGFGHVGPVSGFLAELQQDFLDGAGAPLRNVHKFDVVLRLPLILGLAHLIGVLGRAASVAGARRTAADPGAVPQPAPPARRRSIAVTMSAIAAVLAIASPALTGGLTTPGSYFNVPDYWRAAATWLDQHLDQEHVLVVPAARFPRYLWGSPSDEITQPLLESRWGVRSSIPLTPPMTIRLLDVIESTLADGNGSRGLADLLARSGIRYLLVRSDLDYGRSGAAQPVRVQQALARSPGIRPVTGFGPTVGGGHLPGNFVDRGLDVPVRTLQVYEVNRSVDPVVAYDADAVTTVVGGPESLLNMAATGQLTAAPTVLAGDRPDRLVAGPVAVTDGLRRREVSFGRSQDNRSATLTATEPWRLAAPAHDYLPDWGADQTTVVDYHGIRSVTASSSFAEALPLSGGRPAHQPYAALDGDPETSWRSAPGTVATDQWFEVELETPQVVSAVRLTFDLGADSAPTRVTVSTGREGVTAAVSGDTVVVSLPGGHAVRWLTVTIDSVLDMRIGHGGVGIRELEIPGVRAERTLTMPAAPVASEPASMVFAAAPSVASCFFHEGRPICADHLSRASEDGDRIDRTVRLGAASAYLPRVWARPRPGPALNALLDAGGRLAVTLTRAPAVTASSADVPDPAARPGAVVDGDPATSWYAADDDQRPWLRLTWPSPREVTGVRLTLDHRVAAARPWRVEVIGDSGVRGGVLSPDGTLMFEKPLRTDDLTVLIADREPARSHDPYDNRSSTLPVAVGELTALPEAPVIRADPAKVVTLPCGSGPTIDVAGVRRSTSLVASRQDLLELRDVEAVPCGADRNDPVLLPADEFRLVVTASRLAVPTEVGLTPDATAGPGTGGGPTRPLSARSLVRVDDWSATVRRLDLPYHPVDRVLALRENANRGWQATAGGITLTPITLDGWQQGWIVPAGVTGEVVLRFTPDGAYRTALTGGAGVLAVVVLLAVLPSRHGGKAPPPPVRGGSRRRRGLVLPAAVGGVALLSVGGTAAVGLALLGAVVLLGYQLLPPMLVERHRLDRLARPASLWLPVACFGLAGWAALDSLDGYPSTVAQLAALGTATALWFSTFVPGLRLDRLRANR
ncbi:alpha-(1-_3)-arabinofuranosyltransferase [Micromonospora sonneratiae]